MVWGGRGGSIGQDLGPKKSTKFIHMGSDHVQINKQKIENVQQQKTQV